MATWQSFLTIPNGTRIFNYGYDQCVALANSYWVDVLGLPLPSGIGSASQWWTTRNNQPNLRNNATFSSTPVAGSLFVALGGIYDRTHGHIGLVTSVNANGTFNTMEQNAGTWRYTGRYTRDMSGILGFIVPNNNPANVPLEPDQRKTGANPANRRSGPSTTAALKEPQLAANTVGNFTGWIYGDHVNDGIASTNIWYRGISGDWFWAGAFTSISTTGLTDLNPKAPPVGSNQRKVDPIEVLIREAPTTNSAKKGGLAPNSVVTPEGWVNGQSVQGIAIWYKVSGGYAWAGGFTVENTTGLNDLNPKNPDPIDPPVPTDPTGPEKDLGFPGSVLATIERWSESAPEFTKEFPRPMPATVNAPLPDGVEEIIKRPNGNFNIGREAAPNHHVVHHGGQPVLTSLVNTLMGPEAPSANFALKDKILYSMVDTRDTPATNGRWRSNQYSVTWELANDKTTTDKPSAETHELAAWGIARETLRWGMKTPLAVNETVFGHKDVSKSPTSCPGEVDLNWITNRANEIIVALQSNEEVPAPDYSDLTEAISGLTKLINKLIDLLKSIFKVG